MLDVILTSLIDLVTSTEVTGLIRPTLTYLGMWLGGGFFVYTVPTAMAKRDLRSDLLAAVSCA